MLAACGTGIGTSLVSPWKYCSPMKPAVTVALALANELPALGIPDGAHSFFCRQVITLRGKAWVSDLVIPYLVRQQQAGGLSHPLTAS